VVAGNGKRSAYTDLINSHPHTVHFLPSTDCVANYYSMLDVFVLPAHIEEFGMSALEAMTCSKPVVLHKMVGASEILEGESLRFSLPSLNKEVWVSSVQDLLDDQALRNRVARQNQETSLKYTAKEQNKKFIELVQAAYQES
jgi:UDP-glucose:(heptosyl)LPS alpha-1,3-glucosyltransferase